MAKIVIKKDKKEEPFDVEKLKQSIRVNALDTTLKEAEEGINDLIEKVSEKVILSMKGRDKVSTWEIREKILSELDILAPAVAQTWRQYDEEEGKS